jgi:hypothetical protein
VPLEITHAEMNDAVCAGAATPLERGLPWVAWYLDAWWVEYENGWLRVTDDDVGGELDEVAARLREASAIVEADEAGYRHGSDAVGEGLS